MFVVFFFFTMSDYFTIRVIFGTVQDPYFEFVQPCLLSFYILLALPETSKSPFGGDKRASERLSPARAELRGGAFK